ncbi:type II secretion system GspH family protein, partial [Patescibacteria group bacterium]|nr:type II secretion system GspH family protein [Patescibacteria group bacterium]
MRRDKKNQAGFTLLEMVVTIGIISILVVAGVPAFNSYNKHNSSKIAAQDIKSSLLEAQSLARSPDAGDRPVDFYYVSINAGDDENGKVVIGKGEFVNDDSGNIGLTSTRREFKIDSSAWILDAQPRDSNNPQIVTYYYLVPTGEMLFNGLEPWPGLGYSPKCQALNNSNNCHYQGKSNRNGYI